MRFFSSEEEKMASSSYNVGKGGQRLKKHRHSESWVSEKQQEHKIRSADLQTCVNSSAIIF